MVKGTKITDKLNLTCEDNMDLMARYPDNYFDLAIVDPPYGIKRDGQRKEVYTGKKAKHNKKYYESKGWDNQRPDEEYFTKLKRVSKNQIIWGANHFIENIPNANSSSWIVWDKDNGKTDFADSELAYTSLEKAVRNFKFRWQGMLQGDMKNKEIRIHPTQKPVKLYEWLLMNYAKEGDKILDTHLGSMSIAIACHNLGFALTGCELDQEYYEQGIKRVKNHIAQTRLF